MNELEYMLTSLGFIDASLKRGIIPIFIRKKGRCMN
jgi:hypothetical protein